jgi:hypothetical protein
VGRASRVRLDGLGISIGNIRMMFLATSIKHCAVNVQWIPITTSFTINAPNVKSKHLLLVKRVQHQVVSVKVVITRNHPTLLQNLFFGRLHASHARV